MNRSPFATYRGRLVRRVLIGLSATALGLIFAARLTGGGAAGTSGTDDWVNVFPENKAPNVQPFAADPFLANRQATQDTLDRNQYSPEDRARYDAAVATAVKFAQAYATYDANRTPQSYVNALPGVSAELRPTLLAEATARWPQYTHDKALAAARVSGVPPAVVLFEQLKAEVRVQVLQDVTGLSGQRTNTPTYRVELTWTSNASAGPAPGPSETPAQVASELGGAWSIIRVRVE
ncbi:hypothetical protein AB0H83_36165 [Dactylosporangium sp. NPDC050688]|uniref:hypothetical protein n=1 Tax=Dactylosporangium sp. NPDC050688 TaxID=3157217 RepID=UPI0033D35FAE